MPSFRNRNSGQVVTVSEDPSFLSRLARWECIKEGLSAPQAAPEPVAAPVVTEPEPVAPVAQELALPAADADRDDWVAYAKAQGKTDAQLKGKRAETIRGWFVADDE